MLTIVCRQRGRHQHQRLDDRRQDQPFSRVVTYLIANPPNTRTQQEAEQTAQSLLIRHMETSYRSWLECSCQSDTQLCDVAPERRRKEVSLML
jgi:hypothetical protein